MPDGFQGWALFSVGLLAYYAALTGWFTAHLYGSMGPVPLLVPRLLKLLDRRIVCRSSNQKPSPAVYQWWIWNRLGIRSRIFSFWCVLLSEWVEFDKWFSLSVID